MQNIIIDEEFKALLPALDKDTYSMLEENIIQNGCRDSIVLWGDILIDGHNRYEICSKHDIPFNTISRDFDSREETLIWIISTQVSRRNLTPLQLSHFRGLHYMADKRMQGTGNQYTQKSAGGQNDHHGKTADRLAARYRVSPKTIRRDAQAAAAIEAIGEVSKPAKTMILSGEACLGKAELREISDCPKEELKTIATAIENGTYEKSEPVKPTRTNPENPVYGMVEALNSLEFAIKALSDAFSHLHKVKSIDDRSILKKALRSSIDRLETLYRQIP